MQRNINHFTQPIKIPLFVLLYKQGNIQDKTRISNEQKNKIRTYILMLTQHVSNWSSKTPEKISP